MPYNEMLANRLREALAHLPDVEEKHMFGGVCFMVNGKMCAGVVKDELMCRIDPAKEAGALEKNGCRPMDFTGRSMKGFVYVEESVLKSEKALREWVQLCLDFNPNAKATPKKRNKR